MLAPKIKFEFHQKFRRIRKVTGVFIRNQSRILQ